MGTYHLRENGEPGKCVAQPGNCQYGAKDDPDFNHYDSPAAASTAFEKSQEEDEFKPLSARKAYAAKAVNRANHAPLSYDGEKPQWFVDLAEKADEMWDTGSKTKILDVIDSPICELAVVWEPRSTKDKDKWSQIENGWNLSETTLVSMETGKEVGYLKMSSVSDESFAQSFGNDDFSALRYIQDSEGLVSMGITTNIVVDNSDPRYTPTNEGEIKVDALDVAETPEERLEIKKKIWMTAHNNMSVSPKNATGMSASWEFATIKNMPAEESLIDEDLENLNKVAQKKANNFKTDYKDPFVDFSRVTDDRIVGTGLGSAMYVYTARALAEEKKSLSGSGLQSDEAKHVWERFANNKELPVKKVVKKWSRSGKENEKYELDFRPVVKKRKK